MLSRITLALAFAITAITMSVPASAGPYDPVPYCWACGWADHN
jgi:hypothetical protein